MKGIVVITGIGTRTARKKFKNSQKDATITTGDIEYKINAAAAAAIELNRNGYYVVMLDKCGHCGERIKPHLKESTYSAKNIDLLDKQQVDELAKFIEGLKEKLKLDVHLVHYGSVTATKMKLPRDTIFLSPWETPGEEVGTIMQANIAAFYNILQSFKKILQNQHKTKIIIISALAAIRTGHHFGLDAIQKGAVHSMARTLALDLHKENIFVTEIMPGTTDTGYYDLEQNLKEKINRGKTFGYEWDESTAPFLSAMRVGETVRFVLDTDAHIREISLIPYGQHPHLGA